MNGVLQFQTKSQNGTETHDTETVTRDNVVEQLNCMKRMRYNSDCIYHLDGSITIQLTRPDDGHIPTITMTGSFTRI